MQKHKIILGLASVLAMGAVNAHEAGSFIVRGGGIFVSANSDSVTKTPINVNLDVGDNAQLGLTGTYMFTDNFGIELLGATPFSHKISAAVPALKLGLGDVVKLKQLPPSLYAQYYFLDQDSGSRPYVGAGINYTRFFSAKPMVSAITDLDVKKHSFSPILNAGIDIKLTDNVYLNTAMWYTKIKTTAKFKALGASHEVKVKLDPLVFFTGLAYRF
ncbi:OmpW family protein [Aggregatibacter actinomycetemcomitans]|uniref:OmpW/AlkL family protein n=1 Tax=Aggregatibacter actinomycetemcomitans TaxID=714 RepID=UPI00197BADE5|nr:OmpW family protein [Aggregatibacter actinomycetemcomitans]MBN6076779.1 OmpW family protein [Aggregatibacter actinomycetemcomitans]